MSLLLRLFLSVESAYRQLVRGRALLPVHDAVWWLQVSPRELQEAEQQECLRLQFFVYDMIGRLLVDYMFDIMMDYPDSAPAVLDLSECMKRTNLHRHFVDSLSAAIRKRLLHPGTVPPVFMVEWHRISACTLGAA